MDDVLSEFKQIIKAILILIIASITLSMIFAITFTIIRQQSISYFISYFISCIVLIIINRHKLKEDLKSIPNDYHNKVINILIFTSIFLILMLISNYIIIELSSNISNNEENARTMFFSSPVIMGISISIFAPIFEELVSRYPYRDININPKLKLFIYSSIFALLHLFPITCIYDILFIIPYFFLSITFSYSFYKTNNIYGSILVHILNNSITLLLLTIF